MASLRWLSASMLCLAAAGAWAGHPRPSEQDLYFRVFLDDREIGYHSFRVAGGAERETVEIDAEFAVTFLAFPVYSYDHRNREVWRDGCLQRLASETDDNGDEYRVEGNAGDGVFRIATAGERREIDTGCVMTFAYWNEDFLAQARLLNAQTGEYLPVETEFDGVETIRLDERDYRARHYRVRNREQEIDIGVWYDADSGRWLSLQSRVGSRVIRYVPAERRVANRGEPPTPYPGTEK